MKNIVVVSSVALAALLVACGNPKNTCKDTGCSAGSTCNATTGMCEITGVGGGGGSLGGGGGSSGGGGGSTGGGGGSMDAGFDAGLVVVDPFEDGGTFPAGDICSRAIVVNFDGGTTATLNVDLSMVTHQYQAACNNSDGETGDIVFEIDLPAAKGLVVTADGDMQDSVIAVLQDPCPLQTTVACIDSTTEPEVLTVERLPAGKWYVLLENYGSDASADGPYTVQFELTDPPPSPSNDTCAGATPLTLMGGSAQVMGTTIGAFNDTASRPLTCLSGTDRGAEVFYTLTLTQTQDVTVNVEAAQSSNATPAVAMTNACGVGGMGNERGCRTGSSTTFTARSVPAGTYTIVVDGTGSDTGDFALTVTTSAPTPVPANDTCNTPATLQPMVTQMVDANAATDDYDLSCASTAGGDVVYQFTTTQDQTVRITATGMNSADAVISLRAAPCDDDTNEVACVDDEGGSSPEVLETQTNVPAGTYYVVVAAYNANAGQFGVALELLPPITAPANESCTAPQAVTLTGGTATATADLRLAAADIALTTCASGADGGDVVYQLDVPAMSTLTVSAATSVNLDPVLALFTPACAMAMAAECVDDGGSGDDEELVYANTTASSQTVFVLVKAYSTTGIGTAQLTFSVTP